jgi:hypothetical protein
MDRRGAKTAKHGPVGGVKNLREMEDAKVASYREK